MSHSLRIQSNQQVRLNGFISKLSYIFDLNNIKKEGWSKIHGWSSCKQCIKIFDKDKFLEKIISKFFSLRKIGSFLRQLNLYNFKKTSRENVFYNQHFTINRNGSINQDKLDKIVRKSCKSGLELNNIKSTDSYGTNLNNSEDYKMKRKTEKRKLTYSKLKPKFSEDMNRLISDESISNESIYENNESQPVKRSKRIKDKYEKKCKKDIIQPVECNLKIGSINDKSIHESGSNNEYNHFSDLSSLSTDSEDTDTIFEKFNNRNSEDFELTEYNKDLLEDIYNQDYDNREFYYSSDGIDKDISGINFIEDDTNYLDSFEKNNDLFFPKSCDTNAKYSKYYSDIDFFSLLNYIEI